MKVEGGRVAVVFKGFPSPKTPSQGFYIVSLRDQKRLRPGVSLRQVAVDSYADVSKIPWHGQMELNYAGYASYKESRHLFTSLFFLDIMNVTELWFVKTKPISIRQRSVAEKGFILYHQETPSSKQPLYLYRLRFQEELVSLLWPDMLYELHDSVCVGVNTRDATGYDITSDPVGVDALVAMLKSSSIERFSVYCTNIPAAWKYVVKMDLSFYDAGDPLYYLPNHHLEQWEKQLTNTLSRCGYQVHIIPMLDALIWNWIGYGEIPKVRF